MSTLRIKKSTHHPSFKARPQLSLHCTVPPRTTPSSPDPPILPLKKEEAPPFPKSHSPIKTRKSPKRIKLIFFSPHSKTIRHSKIKFLLEIYIKKKSMPPISSLNLLKIVKLKLSPIVYRSPTPLLNLLLKVEIRSLSHHLDALKKPKSSHSLKLQKYEKWKQIIKILVVLIQSKFLKFQIVFNLLHQI